MSGFVIGDEVLAPWLDDGFFYPATIVALDSASAHVAYFDGAEADVPLAGLRRGVIGVNANVSVNWKGKGLYYKGVIQKRVGAAVYLFYEDGTYGWATLAQVRILGTVLSGIDVGLAACGYCGNAMYATALQCDTCGAPRSGRG